MNAPKPRFARVAAMIADPTRARMLALLMNGQAHTAGELAAAAGVTPATASGHLAQLVDTELVVPRAQGRHRYFRLADERIAHALEALSLVAERGAADAKWQQPDYLPLKRARTCYCHLAGELGVAWLEGLLRCGHLQPQAGWYALTPAGRQALAAAGIGLPDRLPATPLAQRRFAYPCLDWSERRDHLAGTLAVALLAHARNHDWLRSQPASRALQLTPAGRRALTPWLAVASAQRTEGAGGSEAGAAGAEATGAGV